MSKKIEKKSKKGAEGKFSKILNEKIGQATVLAATAFSIIAATQPTGDCDW